jgi:hypothetical protein
MVVTMMNSIDQSVLTQWDEEDFEFLERKAEWKVS